VIWSPTRVVCATSGRTSAGWPNRRYERLDKGGESAERSCLLPQAGKSAKVSTAPATDDDQAPRAGRRRAVASPSGSEREPLAGRHARSSSRAGVSRALARTTASRPYAIAAMRTGPSAAWQLSGMEATANRSLPLSYAVQFGSRARVTIASCVSGPKNGPGPADAVGFPDGPSAPEA
jgi:hypothetical protein